MRLDWRALDGCKDKARFIDEWAGSGDRDATFVLTKDEVFYLVPYGVYDFEAMRHWERYGKWESPFRSHGHVVSDFELDQGSVVGGGYLRLSLDGLTCVVSGASQDYGPAKDLGVLVELVTETILR